MSQYDNWKLSDPGDNPRQDMIDRILEEVSEEHPDWTEQEVYAEMERLLQQFDEDVAEAKAEARERAREYDREGY